VLCQERYKKRHTFLFDFKEQNLYFSDDIQENLTYFLNFVPIVQEAINVVFKSHRKVNLDLERDITNFNDCINYIIRLLKKKNVKNHIDKILEKINIAQHYLINKTEVGRIIDFYHPNIHEEIIQLIEDETTNSDKNFSNQISIIGEYDERLCLLGDRKLLRDTIKNNSIDIIKNSKLKENNVGIKIESTEKHAIIKIYYSSIDSDLGISNLSLGTSYSMHNSLWENYGGIIRTHEVSDIENYKSFITLIAQKGF
jgi:hypothetical protein